MRTTRRVTRRSFLKGAGRGALVAGAAGTLGVGALQAACSDSSEPTPTAPAGTITPVPSTTPVPQRYSDLRSRPDLNNAPTLNVLKNSGEATPGFIFLTAQGGPAGPALFDSEGRLVWFNPVSTTNAFDFKVVRYKGADHVAWFEGTLDQLIGVGSGSYVLHDSQYKPVARIWAGGGGPLDSHEIIVTPRDTALVCVYQPLTMDLTSMGGLANATVLDSVIQEIDIASGAVVFEWHSLDHVGPEESVSPVPTAEDGRFDPFHINSIDVDTDGNLLVSARNTCGLYKVNHATGDVMWRIVGAETVEPREPFLRLEPESTSFYYQHDLRRNADGTMAIYDNGGYPYKHDARALVFEVDEAGGTATLVRDYGSEFKQRTDYQGSTRVQPNGNVLVGWGNIGRTTEFTPDGDIAFDATFSSASYRVLRFDWKGTPADPPAIAVERDGDGARVWASWNGATEVRSWRILGGDSADSLEELSVQPWEDFETEMSIDEAHAVLAVEALDANGAPLGRSTPAPLA